MKAAAFIRLMIARAIRDTETITWGLYLQNSIIAGSKGGGDCVAEDEIDHNIGMYIADGSCEPACDATDGPINLGELQGEPAYHPLLDGSIAINRADTEVCSLPDDTDTTTSQGARSQQAQDIEGTNVCEELEPGQDQIGTNRPMYGNCDIGAIESRTGTTLEEIEEDEGDIGDDPPDTDTPVPPDTDTPVPPDTDTPVPPDTDTPVPPDTDTPVPPDTDTPVPPDTDTPVPPPTDTDTPVPGNNNPQDPQDPPNPQDPEDTDTPVPPPTDTDTPVPGNNNPLDPQDPLNPEDPADTDTPTPSPTATQAIGATLTEVANLPPLQQTAFALTETATHSIDPLATMSATPDPLTQCTHTVAVGDTLFQLAQTYNTTVEKFRAINQLTEDALYVGSELIVPDCYRPSDGLDSSALGFSCQNLFDNMVVRTTSQVVGCREVNTELIDKHPALASGMIAALDIFGYVESGVEVCFRNIGELVFLDGVNEPPTPQSLPSYNNAVGMTCGEVENVGTLVLVAAVIERDTFVELSSCRVTTTQTLRLRDEVGSSTALGLVPYNVTLDTFSRTANWFNVNFLGRDGWISANYVRTEGVCQ